MIPVIFHLSPNDEIKLFFLYLCYLKMITTKFLKASVHCLRYFSFSSPREKHVFFCQRGGRTFFPITQKPAIQLPASQFNSCVVWTSAFKSFKNLLDVSCPNLGNENLNNNQFKNSSEKWIGNTFFFDFSNC